MAMPPCATFHYAGFVPDTRADRESGQWQLQDKSGAFPSGKSWKPDPLRDNRLLGLQPRLRIVGSQLVLEASGRHRAQICRASLELDELLIAGLQGADVVTLVRTGTADIGVSILRGAQLMVAVGAVTAIPLGDSVAVQGGPEVDLSALGPKRCPRRDTWVDVSVSGEVRRLQGGEETTIRNYRFSVVRCFEDGIPGTYESLAISLGVVCPHDAAMHSAELLARPNAGLIMAGWS